MPNIRIKDIPTTASATSSTDFIGIDGSANGTRKLSAYSPTFGGNLTVSGTGTSGISGSLMVGSSGFTPGVPAIGIYRAATSVPVVYSALNNSYGWSWGLDASSNYIVTYNGGTGFGTTAFTLANTTGNATLTGNLTVSGTGNSSFAGPLNVTASTLGTFASSTANATSGEQAFTIKGSNSSTSTNFGSSRAPSLVLWNNSGAANSYAALVFQDGGGNAVAGVQGLFIDDATNHGALTFWSRAASGSYAEAGRFTGSGNLLLKSDGVDSANGKLQLATHTTSAGGIGFGTDVSLFRSGSGTIRLSSTATAAAFRLINSVGTTGLAIEFDNNIGYIWNYQNASLLFGTNNTTALTLDSSQNATFAGTVRSNAQEGFKIAAASGYFAGYEADGTTLNGYLQFINSVGTLLNQSIAGKNIALAIAGTPQLTLTTGNATFAGSLRATGASASGSSAIAAYGADNNNLLTSYNSTNNTSVRLQANAAANYIVSAGAIPLYIQTNSTLALTLDSSQNATFAGTVVAPRLNSVSGITSSVADGAYVDISLTMPRALVSYIAQSNVNTGHMSAGFFRSNDNGANSTFTLFSQSENNIAVTYPSAGKIRLTNNTGGTVAINYAFTVISGF